MITKWDKKDAQLVAERIRELLAPLATELGINLRCQAGTFSSNNLMLKVELNVVKDGTAITREAETFNQMAKYYGLDASDLGKTFTTDGGRVYTLIGLNRRAKQYPFLGRDTNGITYKLSERTVLNGLGKPMHPPIFGSSQGLPS